MLSINDDSMFSDLTTDEQSALNGGYFCRYVYFWRRVCYGFYCFWQWAYAWRCY
ncbi:hypothetical protein ABN584_03755 [Gloeocapsa sp. BRSZ]